MKYSSIDSVVKSALIGMGDADFVHYPQCLQFAYECCRHDLSVVLPHYVRTQLLTVSDNFTIQFPEDCVKVLKVAKQCGAYLGILTVDENLALPRKLNGCGNIVNNPVEPDPFSFLWEPPSLFLSNYWYGGVSYTYFGYGLLPNQFGTYQIDYEKNQIQLGSNVKATELYVEYKSNGLAQPETGEELIPFEAFMAARAYIIWQYEETRRTSSPSEKQRKMLLYKQAKKDMKANIFSPNEQDLLRAIRSGYKQSPKY